MTYEKIVWRLLRILNTESPYDLLIPFLGIYARELETSIQTNTCTQVFIATLFAIAKR